MGQLLIAEIVTCTSSFESDFHYCVHEQYEQLEAVSLV